jgi:GT2 family glycosyltransferase
MSNTRQEETTVTIVVVPRERFSVSQASLESIYRNTEMPFELVYVDGGSPAYVQNYLQAKAAEKGFHLLRTDHFLSPNQARNLGVQHARRRYVVFVDNDALVAPGWLEALTGCAEETGASVVAPLYFIGKPEKRILHMAGGDLQVEDRGNGLFMTERHRFANRPLSEVEDRIKRERCGFAEFHCMLVRKQMLDELGPLDEKLYSLPEHIDLCYSVELAGGSTWLEPAAQVTYRADAPFRLSDIPYFEQRWSDDWNSRSISHFEKKWNLVPDCPMFDKTFRGWVKRHGQQLTLSDNRKKPIAITDAATGTAQTNIQLYRQCMALEYRDRDLIALRDTYRLAQAWFNGLYRGCGKPFLAHLVGSASILARYGAPVSVVAAGMLHSVYSFGVLGIEGRGITDKRRRYVARRTSPGVEILLCHYASIDWYGTTSLTELVENLDDMPLTLARVLLLRMASELEERHDRSLAFFAKKSASTEGLEPWLPLFRKVAERIGAAGLYEELNDAVRKTSEFSAPESLCSQHTGSYTLEHLKNLETMQPKVIQAEQGATADSLEES